MTTIPFKYACPKCNNVIREESEGVPTAIRCKSCGEWNSIDTITNIYFLEISDLVNERKERNLKIQNDLIKVGWN